jgi:phosphoribosylformimino-5-aminoimidazole carboxamide ribotide isomerase
MIVYPAIDLRGGRVVRLRQGDYAAETRYADEPLEVARRYRADGAQWIHVVDLDAARDGTMRHRETIAAIARDSGLTVQAGGGVRSEADVEALLDAGVSRVVIGSLAVREPERVAGWIGRFGAERICVALDTRADQTGRWQLPVAGWTEDSGVELDALIARYATLAPIRHVLCTDITRDGMLSGPSVALYRTLATRWSTLAVQASGGIRDAADIAAARDAGCAGAIIGKALLDGRVALAELLAC